MDIDYKKIPLNTEYKNLPINQHGRFLKFFINSKLPNVTKKRFIDNEYIEYSDELIINESVGYNRAEKGGFKFYLGVAAFTGIICPLIFLNNDELETFVSLILAMITIFFLGVTYYMYKKWQNTSLHDYIVYDRLNGEITIPDYDRKKHSKINFNELKARIHKIKNPGVTGGMVGPHQLFYNLHTTKKLVKWDFLDIAFVFYNPQETWSFFVWYMDKNRNSPSTTCWRSSIWTRSTYSINWRISSSRNGRYVCVHGSTRCYSTRRSHCFNWW